MIRKRTGSQALYPGPVALLEFLPPIARARIIPANACKLYLICRLNVVNGLARWRAERHASLSTDICDGEISMADHVHSNEYVEVFLRRRKLGHENANNTDLVRQEEVYEVRVSGALSITVMNLTCANRGQTERLDERGRHDALACTRIP